MVGHKLCEKLVEKAYHIKYNLITFCEEPRPAYDRVQLTKFFEERSAEPLMLGSLDWYKKNKIELHVGDKAAKIDREKKLVLSEKGVSIPYHAIVLATGSSAFVPPIPGVDKKGVFVYRTIEDLEQIIEYSKSSKKAAVIGGGLLGLEAAKAALDLGLKTHVIEFAPRLMPRQIDDMGGRLLKNSIESLGVKVHTDTQTQEIQGNGKVQKMLFKNGEELDVDMIIVSAGIRPRDELAKDCGLDVHPRGGVIINNKLQTSDPDIYAIGEVALHNGLIYGLVAPGYEMADVLASNLLGDRKEFKGADTPTKLKLMGVDVANFGDAFGETPDSKTMVYQNDPKGVYQRLTLSKYGDYLLGGMLVGDASLYNQLLQVMKNKTAVPKDPEELLLGKRGGEGENPMSIAFLPDSAQICSCNNISKGDIVNAVRDGVTEIGALKNCTNAGTGCGGCLPMVQDILNAVLESEGKAVSHSICEHFPYSRQELFDLIKIGEIKSFSELLLKHGRGEGCEVCKPAIASIFASVWNEMILEQDTLQDTNDRFLANIQKGGTYSVVPRVPGGEILPEQLITIGSVAKKYNLYCKITGGQRIDLFGAQLHELPKIWEELIAVGLESGHAYGKALRTVKSCVGSTWCRYGVQDSTGFAIRLENRYKGIRAPHKLKSACSGCVRECAEAQSKDFGVVATDKGWNLYVCGNGGAKPQHGVLLATDIPEETVVRYLDRFIMYYIKTADKLTRTATWFNKLQGGLDYLKEVIIEDKLGIADTLEKDMLHLIDTYQCEWKSTVENPEKRKKFRHFINSNEGDDNIQWIYERGQKRPNQWIVNELEEVKA